MKKYITGILFLISLITVGQTIEKNGNLNLSKIIVEFP